MKIFRGLIVAICLMGACSKAVQHTYRYLHQPATTQP
jgi:hypothetical protein